MSLISCSFSGAIGGITAVMYLSMKAQTTSSGSLSILGPSFTHSKQRA